MHDLRLALRMLRRRPLFTAAAVLTLALGIGLNTAVFSVVHALLFRPLPLVAEPDRLVQVYRSWPGLQYGSNSVPHFFDVRDRTGDVFSGMAAWTFRPFSLSAGGRNERVFGQIVSADFFEVLGVRAAIGRTFLPEEDVGAGAHAVAVLSHGFWVERFASDPDVVGREILLNGRAFTVVGVMPKGFRGAHGAVQATIWAPLMMEPVLVPGGSRLEQRGHNFLSVIARLAPGVTAERAQQALDRVQAALAEELPDAYQRGGMLLVPQDEAGIHPMFRAAQIGMSALVMAVVALLLLLACVNVANLFLVRAGERMREMGIRLSIGASRARLIRQLLTESVLFGLVAGAAGLVLAIGGVRIANTLRPPGDVPIDFDIRLDVPVLLFALGISIVAGVLFGLVPALQASRPDLARAIKGETTGGEGRQSRLTSGLVIAQVALSILLLIGAGLFVRNLRAATAVEKGFRSENLLLVAVDPGLQGYERERTETFYRTLMERVRAMPGVRAAGLGEMVPLGFGSQQNGVSIPGYEPREDERMSIDYNIIGPGYFEAMGIPVRGRGFTEQDAGGPPVLVINERMAERFWPGEDAIGKRVGFGDASRQVVGIVPTGRYQSLGEDPLAFMYVPQSQYFNHAMTLHVRTSGPPEELIPLIREEVGRLDPDLPLFDVRTMENHLGISLMPARLAGGTLGVFGALGLVLAAVGLYGVISYSVARRTREIGIRVALGADRASVVGMVLRQGVRLVVLGVVLGLAAAAVAGRLVRGLLYTGSPLDPVTFAAVPVLLGAVALFATWLPARRAAAVEPMRALKSE